MRLIREFENPDGINDSVRVCIRESLNGERYLLFFGQPLGCFARPEFLADLAVQFVQVSLIDPMTHRTQSLLQSFALLLPNRFVAAFIGEQGLFKLAQNVVWNMNVLEDFPQP
ncbi:MAG TPA: hypothetical protein VJP02_15410 [Candidatus Sulfotelmatobacter sp.]|nr:hypothetical protein [Candidatus Sulfotelmatobacter sp.]